MAKSDIDRIRHIKLYCEDIAETIRRYGDSFITFTQDKDFYKSVSMSVLQIGELSGGLSDGFRNATRSQMPWGMIKGMRNRFAHAYDIMEKSDVWETATQDIPNLLIFCDGIIERGEAD